MNKLSGKLFGIAAVLALLAGVLQFIYTREFERRVSGGKKVAVLSAVQSIERGIAITDEMLAVREVPQAYLEDRAVRAPERARVVGLHSSGPVQPGQSLLWTDIVTGVEDQRDLSALVPPGRRAVQVHLYQEESPIGLIRPGDYVDIIAVFPSGNGESRVSSVLLQKVLVLSTGYETSHEVQRGVAVAPIPVISVSVNLQEAQMLALGSQKGHLSVALRSPNDQRVAENLPDLVSAALFDESKRSTGRFDRKSPTRLDLPH